MAEVIRMPKMSDTMTEGVIATWHKKIGDIIKSGDIIAEVETDKATMDLESYQEGTLLYIGAEKGAAVAVDGVMAIVGAAGEDYQALLGEAPQSAPQPPMGEQIQTPPSGAGGLSSGAGGAVVVTMPKMSDTMVEGVIVAWLKKVGDVVKSGDIIAEVETDKATMELENYEDGTLLYVGAKEGEAVAVDGIIAIVGEPGADFQRLLAPQAPQPPMGESTTKSADNLASPSGGQTTLAEGASRIKASPLAKAMAEQKGVDLSKIAGSGEGGRIVKRDLDAVKSAVNGPQSTVVGQVTPAVQRPTSNLE
ncbi:MAG: pyruvate dehydrogenase, partial [Runella slithyformis]